MKTIVAKRRILNLTDFKSRSAKLDDFGILIKEPTKIFVGNKLMAVYDVLNIDDKSYVEALKVLKFSKHFRANSSKTNTALPTISAVIGFQPRLALRRDFCGPTATATNQPVAHNQIASLLKEISASYKSANPQLYEKHIRMVREKVLPQYAIEKSAFTSGIVNKNNQLLYHFDTGNFKDVWSCMAVFRLGTTGGYLAIPELNIGIECANKSLFMFDGQGILHGVTPIIKTHMGGYRYSIVFYSLSQMWKCLPVTEELARIKQKKTIREVRRAKL